MFQYKPFTCCSCNHVCKREYKYYAINNVYIDCAKSTMFKSITTCLRDEAYYDIHSVVIPLLTSEIAKQRTTFMTNVITINDFMMHYYLGGYKMWNVDNNFITVPAGVPSRMRTQASDDPILTMQRTMRCILKGMKELVNIDPTTPNMVDVIIPWINLDVNISAIDRCNNRELSEVAEVMLSSLSGDFIENS